MSEDAREPQNSAGTKKAAQEKFLQMTTAPVPPLLLKLGIPTMCSMLVTALYNTASTYYVSYLGTAAVGAMGVVFALQMIIQAIGIMIGQGCAAQTSRLLGAKDFRRANTLASSALALTLTGSVALAAAALLALDPFLRMLGATPTILGPAREYAGLILAAAPFMAGAFALNNILRSEGLALVGTIGLASGGILNIAVAPLFIFTFDMGIRGAALATAICQTLAFLLLLTHYALGRGTIEIGLRLIARDWRTYASIIATGIPSLTRNLFAVVAAAVLNLCAGQFGDAGVAAMSMVGRVMMIFNAAMVGLGQGYQPILGYNWGAKKYKRVVAALDDAAVISTVIMSLLGGFGFFFAAEIIGFFETNDPAVMAIGVLALKLQCLIAPLVPVNLLSNMSYQVLGRTAIATLLASLRQGVVFLPLILTLPPIFGVEGLAAAQPLSEAVSLFICGWFLWHFRKEAAAAAADQGAQRSQKHVRADG